MSLALHAAPVEHEQNTSSVATTINPGPSGRVESVKKRMNIKSFDDDDDDDDGATGMVAPPQPPAVDIGPKQWSSQGSSVEPFEPIALPVYSSEVAGSDTDKLDYLIHLLEAQNDIKNGSVTEDLILYSFLGIFIIFVLDNFNRAGKYCR